MLNITQSVLAAVTLLLLVGCTSLLDTQLEESERTSTSCEGETEQDRTTYPTEDIGTVEGKTLENLSFTNTDGSNFSLDADIFADESKRLLLLVTAAGWCTACREEQPALEALYQNYKDQGLEIVVAIFEDNNFGAVTTDFATSWKEITP